MAGRAAPRETKRVKQVLQHPRMSCRDKPMPLREHPETPALTGMIGTPLTSGRPTTKEELVRPCTKKRPSRLTRVGHERAQLRQTKRKHVFASLLGAYTNRMPTPRPCLSSRLLCPTNTRTAELAGASSDPPVRIPRPITQGPSGPRLSRLTNTFQTRCEPEPQPKETSHHAGTSFYTRRFRSRCELAVVTTRRLAKPPRLA